MADKKIAFVVPYFGTLPDYFSEWVYSLSFLGDRVQFLLITDDIDNPILNNIPSNLIVCNMSFDDVKKRIQNKFDFGIALNYPYKICDFKPAYGYIFDDILQGYDFWGNCDIDQVWGDVNGFITDDILENFEKILHLGHFTLYRNNDKMCKMFMNEGAYASYKEIFQSDTIYGLDEFAGMVPICKNNGVKVYFKHIYADIDVRYSRMRVKNFPNYKKQIIYWKNGEIFRSYIDSDELKTESFLYAHFQKKHPVSINANDKKPSAFIIGSKEFIDISNEEICVELVEEYSDFVDDATDENDKKRYMKNKIRDFLKSSAKNKILWVRKKLKSVDIYNQ